MANPFATITNTVGTLAAGHVVLATEWNTAVGGIYSYINTTLLTGGLNKLTAKGDIYVHDGTSLQRLPVGADASVLQADSTQTTGLKYATVASTSVGLLSAKGDLVVRDATQLQRLPVGTDGQVLTARASASNGVQWETAPGVPIGGILLWHQAFGSIPSGYNVCDGGTYNGIVTPNMQGLYVVGASGGVNPPAAGGLGALPVNTPAGALTHSHSVTSSTVNLGYTAGGTITGVVTSVGSTSAATVKPPYNTLFFIMRTI